MDVSKDELQKDVHVRAVPFMMGSGGDIQTNLSNQMDLNGFSF